MRSWPNRSAPSSFISDQHGRTDEQRGIATHVERADRDRGVKACYMYQSDGKIQNNGSACESCVRMRSSDAWGTQNTPRNNIQAPHHSIPPSKQTRCPTHRSSRLVCRGGMERRSGRGPSAIFVGRFSGSLKQPICMRAHRESQRPLRLRLRRRRGRHALSRGGRLARQLARVPTTLRRCASTRVPKPAAPTGCHRVCCEARGGSRAVFRQTLE